MGFFFFLEIWKLSRRARRFTVRNCAIMEPARRQSQNRTNADKSRSTTLNRSQVVCRRRISPPKMCNIPSRCCIRAEVPLTHIKKSPLRQIIAICPVKTRWLRKWKKSPKPFRIYSKQPNNQTFHRKFVFKFIWFNLLKLGFLTQNLIFLRRFKNLSN